MREHVSTALKSIATEDKRYTVEDIWTEVVQQTSKTKQVLYATFGENVNSHAKRDHNYNWNKHFTEQKIVFSMKMELQKSEMFTEMRRPPITVMLDKTIKARGRKRQKQQV